MDKVREAADERLVMTIPEAGKRLGLSRDAAYRAAKRGEIPVIEFGGLKKVPIVQDQGVDWRR